MLGTGETAKASQSDDRRLNWTTAGLYGMGAIASAAKTAPITTFLMLYYNQVVGLSALTVSTVLMVTLVVDAVCDPLVGEASDNHVSRLGRRLPFMYLAVVPVTTFFVMIWSPPLQWPHFAIALYLLVCLIGLRIFDTFFEIPHLALIPDLAPDGRGRTTLFTIRSLFDGAGGIAISALAYNVFMREGPDGTGGLLSGAGYPPFAIFAGCVIFATMLICTRGLQHRLPRSGFVPVRGLSVKLRISNALRVINSRSFGLLAAAAVVVSIASGLASALNIYWLIYFYRLSQAEMSVLFVPVILGMTLTASTPGLTRLLGKRNAAIALLWLSALVGPLPLLARLLGYVPAQSDMLYVLVSIQAAVGVASMTMFMIIFSSMTVDLVDDAEKRTGLRAEGLMLSVTSFLRKATQGFGTLGAGLLLTLVGFPEGAQRANAPAVLLDKLAWTYICVSFALILLATLPLARYPKVRRPRF